MINQYSHREATAFADRYPDIAADLCLRTYTSQLIGREPSLVLHGGGNTSVKTTITTLLGDELDVLYIKGSGWDLATIEPQGFPALDLDYLRRLRVLERLSDEEMVNQFRTHLMDSTSPNPSIETLVHAFLPHKFIDHTHADAIVTLTNLSDPEARLREVLGNDTAILGWIMPGFPLAQAMADCQEQHPDARSIVLLHHGIFTFGDTADLAYSQMIETVSRAEDYLDCCRKTTTVLRRQVDPVSPQTALPLLRGALARDNAPPFILEWRNNQEIQSALTADGARERLTSGVLTPDHVIRTKNRPLWLELNNLDETAMGQTIQEGMATFEQAYHDYFQGQVNKRKLHRIELDRKPRIILVPGLGLITAGTSQAAAGIAADIAEHTIRAKTLGAGVGPYQELDEGAIFDMEYWSLEQAKLGKKPSLPLTGRTALVTGGGGAIACGIGRQLLAAGVRLYLSDRNQERLDRVCDLLGQEFNPALITPLIMDVSDINSVKQGINRIVNDCGGLDILVPNAGIAHVARLAELDEKDFRQAIDVNLLGVFQVIKAAEPVFRRQHATGMKSGQIIINSSKNVFAPGAAFGAYSTSKAGAHQLGKIAALELAEIGVRVNMINADAIFSDHDISSGLWDVIGPDRMRSRNLDPEGLRDYYRQRNLLKTEVTSNHVGNAVVFFATGLTPTTGATLPVDGGVADAFPR
ncbi:MAG: bifunctional aldolase/short-chain dehydrogenase [Desulfobulbaceae bacterium]|uniref:Bifunctional aldolase/short-chain dehydrogenase n=1 Tax=Candidatus Desulfatifera sulfidica TaxID=2841691 RepID=A0A8J6NAD1_9BACT|nr:bifunctional aldolase/short-chain dehydrogenase [Candidatus Desulfatifera sulfidica]